MKILLYAVCVIVLLAWFQDSPVLVGFLLLAWGVIQLFRHSRSTKPRKAVLIPQKSVRKPAGSATPTTRAPSPPSTKTRKPVTTPTSLSEYLMADAEAETTAQPHLPATDVVSVSMAPTPVAEHKIPKDTRQSARWLQPGEVVTVGPFSITCGLLYAGARRKGEPLYREPSVLDPHAVISPGPAESIGYRPDTATMNAQQLYEYAEWLASGRRGAVRNPHVIVLFVYGIERRLFEEGSDRPTADELGAIEEELSALRDTYGESRVGYYEETRLREIIAFNLFELGVDLSVCRFSSYRQQPAAFSLRIAIGQCIAAKQPLPAALALDWVRQDGRITFRTPASRCPEQFEKLFLREYRKYFDPGLIIPVNKTKLKISYYNNNTSIRPTDRLERVLDTELPDVEALSTPQQMLSDFSGHVTDMLDSYSRFVKKYPDRADSFDASLLLPFDLWPAAYATKVQALIGRATQGMVLLNLAELSNAVGSTEMLSKDAVLEVLRALEAQGVVTEPDFLGGAKFVKPGEKFVLYPAFEGVARVELTPEYQTALITIQVASAVAAADGELSAVELTHLVTQVKSWLHLPPALLRKLLAALRLLKEQPLTFTALKKKLEGVSELHRQELATFIAGIAQVDGEVSPAEVKFLLKVYAALGIEESQLYTQLHGATQGRAQSTPAPSTKPSAKKAEAGFQLDAARISELEKQSAQVSAVLAGIFMDESAAPVTTPPASVQPEPVLETEAPAGEALPLLMGLSAELSDFTRAMLAQGSWTREQLLAMAQARSLMLDGALESINEAAFDEYDEPLTDGEDPIEVNPEIREALESSAA